MSPYVAKGCSIFLIVLGVNLVCLSCSSQVILTGDVSGSLGSRIFISRDFGNSFEQQDLPFNPLMQITYNPRDANVLLVISNTVSGGSGCVCVCLLACVWKLRSNRKYSYFS